MKSTPECLPCILRQVLNTGRRAGASDEVLRELLNRTAATIPCFDMTRSPAHNSTIALKLIPEVTGCADPYAPEKREYNARALVLRPRLEAAMRASADPLRTAALIAVAGNVIDLGIATGETIDVEATLHTVLAEGFAVDDLERLRRSLKGKKKVMYLADNAGEVVFDRELVKVLREMGHAVTVAVHGGPVLNDALREDAEEAGLGEFAEVVSTGSDWVGIEWGTLDAGFQQGFREAGVVIAKGHGNYETGEELDVMPADTYFILRAKCGQVAKSLGVKLGEVALKAKGEPGRSLSSPAVRDQPFSARGL